MAELVWTRKYAFQAVHTLEHARERRHGHRYLLEVSFRGRDIDAVDSVVQREIVERYHGHELKGFTQATGESIVEGIHALLAASPIGDRICAVALQETRKNRFISSMSEARFV